MPYKREGAMRVSDHPIHFVRAEWRNGRKQACAATVWLRGDGFEGVAADTRPGAWPCMFESGGTVAGNNSAWS